ncbi:MAG: CvpA family protein [Flavobacteriales bacterium]|jgi:membrane protein required for colicin V production
MHWVDIVILVLLGLAAVRGFMKGFFVVLAGSVALVLGIWGGIHFHDKVAGYLDIDPSKQAISFLITVVGIMFVVHLVGRVVTKVIDAAQLGLLNKMGGALLGFLSSAFLFSVLLNIVYAKKDSAWFPEFISMDDTVLVEPLQVLAPLILPEVSSSKWVQRTWEQVKETSDGALE